MKELTAAEILKKCPYNAIVVLMDDEIREMLHNYISPCTEEKFLTEYMKLHLNKYGIPFVVN